MRKGIFSYVKSLFDTFSPFGGFLAIRQEYFNHICGSLLNFKKSYSSHLNISRSIDCIVPQMFMNILIKKFNKSSINFQKFVIMF